jgi:nitrite reductase/ring-hydroxylating ferredoxin subunit
VVALTPAAERICETGALVDGGAGVRLTVRHGAELRPAFAVRYGGRVYAYLNCCAHKLTELDWEAGQFFDAQRRYLVCATHGALYEPASGLCVAGPCRGAHLVALAVEETAHGIRLAPADEIHSVARPNA